MRGGLSLIKERDVIRMKVPYPSISAKLAVSAHMYICNTSQTPQYSFIKCQTLKPYMLYSGKIKHYCDEVPDAMRNPFQNPTRIDCDKLFSTKSVEYHDMMKTTIRKDVCVELYDAVLRELKSDGYTDIHIEEDELIKLNPLLTKL